MERITVSRSQKRKREKRIRIRKILLILFFLLFIIFAILGISGLITQKKVEINQSSDTKVDNIIGLWDIDGVTKYQFKKDGKGIMILPNESYSFIYKVKENEITIDFDDMIAKDATYEYHIAGNTMKFISKTSDNVEIEFKKEIK